MTVLTFITRSLNLFNINFYQSALKYNVFIPNRSKYGLIAKWNLLYMVASELQT